MAEWGKRDCTTNERTAASQFPSFLKNIMRLICCSDAFWKIVMICIFEVSLHCAMFSNLLFAWIIIGEYFYEICLEGSRCPLGVNAYRLDPLGLKKSGENNGYRTFIYTSAPGKWLTVLDSRGPFGVGEWALFHAFKYKGRQNPGKIMFMKILAEVFIRSLLRIW